MGKSKPNILVVMTDQHCRSITGAYGDKIVSTPNLDRLSNEGVTFDNAYCPFPLCVPSRMSFMTGRTPSEIDVFDNASPLNSAIPTFANALADAGYETTLCGRMHFVGADQRHGFQSRIFPEVSTHAQGMLQWTNGFVLKSLTASGPGRNHYLLYDKECSEAAVDWLDQKALAQDVENPFCMVMGFVGPHCPFVCPKDLYEKYYDIIGDPDVSEDDLVSAHPFSTRFRKKSRLGEGTAHEIRRTRAAYYGMVEYDDMLIGRVLDKLEETGLAENTVVVYVSDHGELAGEHGLWWKMSFYEDSAAVPMVFSYPSLFPKGERISTPVTLADIAPTLAEIGGSEMNDLAGTSLLPLLTGKRELLEDRAVFSEIFIDAEQWKDQGPSGGPARMIRKGDWKCNYYYGETPELFNLAVDPKEKNNLAADDSYRGLLEELIAEILSDWNPGDLAKRFSECTEIRAATPPRLYEELLVNEYWKGPDNYGYVEEV